jgi:hypothetical protein
VVILLIAIVAIVSMIFLPADLIVPGDAAGTVDNLVANEGTFRISIAGDSVIVLLEIVLVVLLYELLKPVNQTLSLIAAFARLGMTIIQGMNILNRLMVLLLIGDAGISSAIGPELQGALVGLFLGAHEQVILIWGLFFAVHLLVLGYLVYRSGYLARFLGVVLIIASLLYFIQSFGIFLFPEYAEIFTILGFLSIIEIIFPIWLLIKGVNEDRLAPSTA